MATQLDLIDRRKPLNEILSVPEKIISVYSLEQHVWADNHSDEARALRSPELKTIEEFQISPVREFLNDILSKMAAPANRPDAPIGQGFWVQAEFGSGKSHLLCFLSALALGDKDAWEMVRQKETYAGRGKRESIYQFWEDGIETKSTGKNKGFLVVVKTLVGSGTGVNSDKLKGLKLSEFILEAVKDQLHKETGKNISIYPEEQLADRFMQRDLESQRKNLEKFLRDPNYFNEDEFENVDDFLRDIERNRSPQFKKSRGAKLWRFYDEYLGVRPKIDIETEPLLKHMTEAVLAEGYTGVLLVLDEVSIFMKSRNDAERAEDEQTLIVFSNRLTRAHKLPVWTVCSAQEKIESTMTERNILASDRFQLVTLLDKPNDYYNIVLARVRQITDSTAIHNYFTHYQRGFTWPRSIGEDEFSHFFPFHKPALEALRVITLDLTTARSAIYFMHQTLRHQVEAHGNELIRLWELFDETVRYEEDPSGVHASLASLKTRRETEYLAYEACRRQIENQTHGPLKVYRDKAIRTTQTLFLYHVSKLLPQGLTPEEIANAVLIPREPESTPEENNEHYEQIALNLGKELRQIVETQEDAGKSRYRFDPIVTGIDPRAEFSKAREEAASSERIRNQAWDALLALNSWSARTRQMTLDLTHSHKSLFARYAQSFTSGSESLEVVWNGRAISGIVAMRNLQLAASGEITLPRIDTDATDNDFAIFIGVRHVAPDVIERLLSNQRDPRVIVWTPAELSDDAQNRLLDFAAYRKLVERYNGQHNDDAATVLEWVNRTLEADMGKIAHIVDDAYANGRVDALNHHQMDFHLAGEVVSVVAPLIGQTLADVYQSNDLDLGDQGFIFRPTEAVKVVNGIVKSGEIAKGAKRNQDIDAAQNFGFGLKILRRGADRVLDTTGNRYIKALEAFIEDHLTDDGQTMPIETLYKNFMGLGSGSGARYGLTRSMVQLYLLCLARASRIRILLKERSGLAVSAIDYTTIGAIDFKASVLNSLVAVQKMAKPEHWETLRPYAEKFLGRDISAASEDAVIVRAREDLRAKFQDERKVARATRDRATALFERLGVPNPHAGAMEKLVSLFDRDIPAENDIDTILFGLKQALGYNAWDERRANDTDVSDLASLLIDYAAMKRVVAEEARLFAAQVYATLALPDLPHLRAVHTAQATLKAQLDVTQDWVDNDSKLQELLGHPGSLNESESAGDSGALSAMIRAYGSAYLALHDDVTNLIDVAHERLKQLKQGADVRAMALLSDISALRAVAARDDLVAAISRLDATLFSCDNPARNSVRRELEFKPVHTCGLTFENADMYKAAAQQAVTAAAALVDERLDALLSVLLSPAIRQSLSQGEAESAIAALLACADVAQLREHLVPAVLADSALVDLINHYLKQVKVKPVRLAEFKPTLESIERDQINDVTEEFRQFLKDQMESLSAGDEDANTLPVLRIVE